MTRKRFIRLVMASGIQRNAAQRYAAEVVEYGSYDLLYAHYFSMLIGRQISSGFSLGLASLSAVISSVCEKVVDCVHRLFEAVRPLVDEAPYLYRIESRQMTKDEWKAYWQRVREKRWTQPWAYFGFDLAQNKDLTVWMGEFLEEGMADE